MSCGPLVRCGARMASSCGVSRHWRRGGHLKDTKTEGSGEASAHAADIEECTARVENAELLSAKCGFRVSVRSREGKETAGSGGGTKPQDHARVCQVRHPWSGLAYLSAHRKHAGRNGEHQLTIRDYLRHGNLNVTNKYLQATADAEADGSRQTGRRNLADRPLVTKQKHPHSIALPHAMRAINSVATRVSLTSVWSWGAQLAPDWDPDSGTGFLIG